MLLDELRHQLDEMCAIGEWERDPAMSRCFPGLYRTQDDDLTQILEPDFCIRFNGPMLRAAETVEQVYCAAFPCPEVMAKILVRRNGNALLFLHYPADMDVAGTGPLSIPGGVWSN
jgi:hypothetical protein